MREICFTTFAFEEYNEWLFENKKIQQRVKKLITECVRTPFEGTGKPEALKHEGSLTNFVVTKFLRVFHRVTRRKYFFNSVKYSVRLCVHKNCRRTNMS
jgi:toxin YoeB